MWNIVKAIGIAGGKTVLRFAELGVYTMVNQQSSHLMKNRGEKLYNELKDGTEHYGKKLKIIKKD